MTATEPGRGPRVLWREVPRAIYWIFVGGEPVFVTLDGRRATARAEEEGRRGRGKVKFRVQKAGQPRPTA